MTNPSSCDHLFLEVVTRWSPKEPFDFAPCDYVTTCDHLFQTFSGRVGNSGTEVVHALLLRSPGDYWKKVVTGGQVVTLRCGRVSGNSQHPRTSYGANPIINDLTVVQ